MKEMTAVTKALADENRLRIIMMVAEEEACVCQIVEILGYAASTVSKHLSILKQAGLIDSYKKGRWIYYHLPARPSPAVRDALQWVIKHLQNSEVVQRDRKRGRLVCSQAPDSLTKHQRQRNGTTVRTSDVES